MNLTLGPYKYFAIEKIFELALKDESREGDGQLTENRRCTVD